MVLYAIIVFMVGYSIFVSLLGVAPTFIMQVIGLVICLMWAANYVMSGSKTHFINMGLFFFSMLFVYSLLSEFENNQFRCFTYSILITVPFYMFRFRPKQINVLFWLLCIISISSEFLNLHVGREESGEGYYGGGYFALVALPVGLYNLRNSKEWMKALWCMLIFALTLYAAKRGDILGCMVAVSLYYISYLFKGKKRNKIWLILVVVLMALAFYYIYETILQNYEVLQTRQERTEEGYMSQRDVIYLSLWSIWVESDLMHQLFGYGINAPFNLIGIQAHNDWLEFLLDMGLIGVLLYLSLFISLVLSFRRKYVPAELTPIFIAIISIWIVKSAFSMFMFSIPTIMLTMLVGYMLNPNVNHFAIAKPRKA